MNHSCPGLVMFAEWATCVFLNAFLWKWSLVPTDKEDQGRDGKMISLLAAPSSRLIGTLRIGIDGLILFMKPTPFGTDRQTDRQKTDRQIDRYLPVNTRVKKIVISHISNHVYGSLKSHGIVYLHVMQHIEKGTLQKLRVSHFTTMTMVNVSHVLCCFIVSWDKFSKILGFSPLKVGISLIVHTCNQNIHKEHGLTLIYQWNETHIDSAKSPFSMCCITYKIDQPVEVIFWRTAKKIIREFWQRVVFL